MIIPAYSLTASERILPKLTLQFLTGVLDPRITFTRALNTATVTASNGYIGIVNADTPRFDYDPATLSLKGLLLESTRTNQAKYSRTFAASDWTPVNSSIATSLVNAPETSYTAIKLNENTSTGRHSVQYVYSFTGPQTHTFSCYLKQAERTFGFLQMGTAAFGGNKFAFFNLATGQVATTEPNTTARIFPAANGFYRCSITATSISGGVAAGYTVAAAEADNVSSYAGSLNSGIYIYGAQIEVGSFPTSFIPTTTAATQRNADVAVMTGTNFSDWWTATNGAAAVQAQPSHVSGIAPWLQFDDTTADNIIALRGNSANPELYIKATTDQAQIDAGTLVANTVYSLVGAWNTNNCAAAISAGAAVTDTTATIPTVTQARLGSDGTNYLNGWLQNIRYWPQRITNGETQAFSKL